jgi:II/X family phage/plasmid replication protein
MLIDWVTAYLPYTHFTADEWVYLHTLHDRLIKVSSEGEMLWESSSWATVRSDTHQISVRVSGDAINIQGSPARIMGEGCTVFGSGASAALDLKGCVDRMAAFVFEQLDLPVRATAEDWTVTRIDLTENLLLGSESEVFQALEVLSQISGSRLRVTSTAGSSVYFNQKSRLVSGKGYAKGQHLVYQNRQKTYSGLIHTQEEVELARRLLRLECKVGSQFLRELRHFNKYWYQLTPKDLREIWGNFFDRMIGQAEITTMKDLTEFVEKVAPTVGQAKAALNAWAVIQQYGLEIAKKRYSDRTIRRHLKILRDAGLSDTDFSMGQIVPFRKKVLTTEVVTTWYELRLKAA